MVARFARMVLTMSIAGGELFSGTAFPEGISPEDNLRAVSYEDLIGIADLGASADNDYGGLAVSPDGRFAAIAVHRSSLAENSTQLLWLVLPISGDQSRHHSFGGGEPITVTSMGMPVGVMSIQTPLWTTDSEWIIYRAKRNNSIQLWRATRDGGIQEQLTHNAANVATYCWMPGATVVFFTTGKERAQLELEAQLEGERGALYDARFFPLSGKTEPVLVDDAAAASSIWVYDLAVGTERPATDEEHRKYSELPTGCGTPVSQLHWRREASHVKIRVSLVDRRPINSVWINSPLTISVSPSSGEVSQTICEHGVCTGRFKGLWISSEGRFVFFLRWANRYNYGPLALYRWDVKRNIVTELVRTNDLIEGCSHVRRQLVCTYETAVNPRRLVSIDLDSGSMRELYDPNPKFRSLQFGEVTPMTWADSRGVEGFGHLVKPVNYKVGHRYPLVIVQYRSRGFLRGGVGDEYPIHVLASRGFAVLSFDRPTDWEAYESSSSPTELESKLWRDFRDRSNVLSVLLAGVGQLERAGLVDGKKVGITGLSDGANTVAYALVHAPWRFAAAAASYTHWNPISFYLYGPKIQPKLESWGLGDPSDQTATARWRGISVAMNADRIDTPLLIQVSDSELLPETQTFAALRAAGKPVEMYVFPNEGHIKVVPRHRYNAYRRNVQWLEFWLNGVEDSAPIDPEQYVRWHQLRTQQKRECCESSGARSRDQ